MPKFKCQRCGQCCQAYNPFSKQQEPCPYLEYSDDIFVCAIYEDRPQECKGYPKVWCKRELQTLKDDPDRANRRSIGTK